MNVYYSWMKNWNMQPERLLYQITVQSLMWFGQGVLMLEHNICKITLNFTNKLSQLWLKNQDFTKKYTDHKTIISNLFAKCKVIWPRACQSTAWHMKNCILFDKPSLKNLWIKNPNFTKNLQTVRPSHPIIMQSLKWFNQRLSS